MAEIRCYLLLPASVGWGKVIVSVCYFVHGRGGRGYPKVPIPPARSRRGKAVPQGTYPPGQGTYPPARSGRGYPKVPTPLGQVRTGDTPRYLPPGQGTYPPSQVRGRGYPKVPTPSGQGLATRRAVCLLRSRRRTFLLAHVGNVGAASCRLSNQP